MFTKVLTLAALASVATACPGSPSAVRAKCSMEVKFEQSCSVVKREVEARITGVNGWIDPKTKPGTYRLTGNTTSSTAFSRTTGDGQYTDKVTVAYSESSGCAAVFCSESQVFSIGDYDTNYCNSWNLYCNSGQTCNVVYDNLSFAERLQDCFNPGAPAAQPSSCFR